MHSLRGLGCTHKASSGFNIMAETGPTHRACEHSLLKVIDPSCSHAVCFLIHFNQMSLVSQDLLLKIISLIFLKHFIGL